MRISVDGFNRHYTKSPSAANKSNQENLKMERGKQFDKIVISSDQPVIDEEKIVEEAKKEILKEVGRSANDEKIASLKSQVANGTYKIDVDEIVKRMLLQGGNE
ncbi:anti-sigma28 factor (negative regulator of flagellin synthesis) [Aequitasia blattaphilus]|uniref:Flagellar biosynthesis anti-sigma factor FlgM n=1 Tax=Aequitasia blattaphilus TaxID=2949332 RepID=A0ABT1E9N7_9FIRM|nr:flagellar biosynthesis anti-sigma factor FlgM [Aequitasia blattaphilus]MCP1102539.1 flagellar biosynthesis anti-sigma factor FlgM [Aequitasia blattaphilus]MCR8615179.1 flagellar biosynthesis anti-sigma factor FlgM [Aequitasia blattaphilus]